MQVGVSQQWYDELDNLAFSTPDVDLAVENDKIKKEISFQDERIHFRSAVNTSPGTSEVCSLVFLLPLASVCFTFLKVQNY